MTRRYENMCKVFIIAGKTGAGKSTISEWINIEFGFPVISFANIGKTFALNHGKKRLRECYQTMEKTIFVHSLTDAIISTIHGAVDNNDVLIVDGLYAYDAIQDMRKTCKVIVIYIQAEDSARYARISKRLEIGEYSAKKEDQLKEQIKTDLGNNRILEAADYLINGNASLDSVKESIKKIVLKETTIICRDD